MYKVFRKYISERVLISVILSLKEFVFTPLMESADCNSVNYIAGRYGEKHCQGGESSAWFAIFELEDIGWNFKNLVNQVLLVKDLPQIESQTNNLPSIDLGNRRSRSNHI